MAEWKIEIFFFTSGKMCGIGMKFRNWNAIGFNRCYIFSLSRGVTENWFQIKYAYACYMYDTSGNIIAFRVICTEIAIFHLGFSK